MEQNTNEKTNWRDLFSLYRDLVGPFQEFEKRLHRKRELEWNRKANNVKEIISFSYKRIIRNAFSNTLVWAIPFLIVFYVIVNVVHVNEEKLFYYCGELLDPIGEAIVHAYNGDSFLL